VYNKPNLIFIGFLNDIYNVFICGDFLHSVKNEKCCARRPKGFELSDFTHVVTKNQQQRRDKYPSSQWTLEILCRLYKLMSTSVGC
jgi:hypothetical protein